MSQPAGKDDTPAMRQHRQFKQQYPDCVLFFRMGDFYELFYDDAKLANRVLGVTLTQRTQGVPMAGVPYHAVEGYLRRMIQAGHRVAVCEQMEDPAQAKGVVRRDVTRVVTPGTITDEALLDDAQENPLAAIMFLSPGTPPGSGTPGSPRSSSVGDAPSDTGNAASTVAVAWVELSTGAFQVAVFPQEAVGDELARIGPRELLYVETANRAAPPRVQQVVDVLGCPVVARPAWQFRQSEAIQILCKQFGVASLAGFGLTDDDPALAPAGAILHYLIETQRAGDSAPTGGSASPAPRSLGHLQPPRRFERSEHLIIDQTSLRSLEIERTMRSGATEGSLLGILLAGGECRTAMGKRLLRHWLCYPLRNRQTIQQRQRVIGAMVEDGPFLDRLRESLDQVQDIERMMARIGVGRATPRDLAALGGSCAQSPVLTTLLEARPATAIYHDRLKTISQTLAALGQTIAAACVDSPPLHLREGGLIRDGYDAQLDEYRALQTDSQTWLAGYQKQLIEQTGIPSLKVGYNKIFGFYIELTASQRDKAPAGWARKQTLKNAERFITQELKEYEGKVLSAQQRAIAREGELFLLLCNQAHEQVPTIRAYAQCVAELDVLGCLARRAVRRRYVCPIVVDEPVLSIQAGRHPVLDEILGDRFVPNEVELGPRVPGVNVESSPPLDSAQPPDQLQTGATLALITGPNMAGKSTYIRQAALITLLAHTGSFVPAQQAIVGLCDRIFTRIGASDELHAGQSTFMVEMTETANICHHASPQSLVILDEIGRGTSTLDGLSLAWAIAEHLAQRRCRTLFATHYHELTSIADPPDGYPNVANLHVTVREWADQIVFLHRIAQGRTDRSYGIHVAKIAGLPNSVVTRATHLLTQLEVNHTAAPGSTPGSPTPGIPSPTLDLGHGTLDTSKTPGTPGIPNGQLSLFTQYLEHPALDQLRQVDLNRLSPIEAFDLLRKLREQIQSSSPS